MTFASGQNLAGSATFNSAVAFNGSTVSGSPTFNNGVTFNGSNTINGSVAFSTLTVSGTLGGTGVLSIAAGATVNGAGTLNLPVALSGGTLAGTFSVSNFTLTANGGTIGSVATDTITIPSSVTLNNGTTLTLTGTLTSTGGYVTVNSGGTLTGNGALTSDLYVMAGATATGNFSLTSNNASLTPSGGGAFQINGQVTGNHAFTDRGVGGGVNVYSNCPQFAMPGANGEINGTNTFNLNSYFALWNNGATLDGNNTISTPAFYVDGGTLKGNNVITILNLPPGGSGIYATGTSPGVYIDGNVWNDGFTGGIMSGNQTIHGNLTAASNAVISPGTSTTVGTILVDNAGYGAGTVTMDSQTTLNFKLGGGASSDQMISSGNMTLAGTLNVSFLPSFAPGTNTFTLFSTTGTLADTLTANLPSNTCLTHGR